MRRVVWGPRYPSRGSIYFWGLVALAQSIFKVMAMAGMACDCWNRNETIWGEEFSGF